MRFEKRVDLGDEISRVYHFPDGDFQIDRPIAIYSTPGLDYEAVLDDGDQLHLVPRPGTVGISVTRHPLADEPL